MSSKTRRLILIFSLCHLFLVFSYTILLAYLPPYFEMQGLDGRQIGILVAAFHFMTLPMVALFGVVSDRFSPRRLCQVGALFYGVYALGLTQAHSMSAFLPLQAIGGASYAIGLVTLNSLYMKHLSATHRGKKISLFLMAAYIGFGVGPLLAGESAGVESLKNVFFLAGASALGFLAFSFRLKDYPIRSFRLSEYVRDVRGRLALLVIFALFTEGFHVGAEHTSFTLLMKHRLGFTPAGIGRFYLFLGLWMAVITWLLGAWADRQKRWVPFFLAGGTLVSGVFQIFTGAASTAATLVTIRYLHIIGDAIVLWTLAYFISLIFPSDRLGGNYGFTRVMTTLGTSLGAFGFGQVMARGGYSLPFYLSGVFEIGVALFLLSQWRYMTPASLNEKPAPRVERGRLEFSAEGAGKGNRG